MNGIRFWSNITVQTLGRLCRQRVLLALIALLCLILPLCLAPAAEAALSRGVSFSGITVAIVGPEGSTVPEKAQRLISSMRDVSEYCQVQAMPRQEALDRLEKGQITAVLVLPKGFVSGVMDGTNPDLELIVPDDRPFEALLTMWVAQSAADMLSATQSGIYAVLDQYAQSPPPDLSWDEAVAQINLRYISRTLSRQDMFRLSEVPTTQTLSIGLHYALSLLGYLLLAMVPFFAPVFSGRWLAARKRFRCAGRGWLGFYLCGVAACFAVIFALLTGAQLCILRGDPAMMLFCSLTGGLFCAAYSAVCCLLTGNTRNCGILTFPAALIFLFLGGGILPPVLMPRSLQGWLDASPITWLRNTMAAAGGALDPDRSAVLWLLICSGLLLFLGGFLYRRRSNAGKEDAE